MHPAVLAIYESYFGHAAHFERMPGVVVPPARPVYALLEAGPDPLIGFCETAPLHYGAPEALKVFRLVVFEGSGTLRIRALLDGKEVQRGWVVLSKNPLGSNLFRLPEGTIGKALTLQIAGPGEWTDAKLLWDETGVK